jgi:hypothetical protein
VRREEETVMQNLRKVAVLAALSLVAAACGGSSGSGGGGAPTGGAGATPRTTRGALTAASGGSITVNGTTLSVAGAAIRVDDGPGRLDDLRPGAVVTVRGTFDDRSGSAAEIEVEHAIEGRVDDKGTDFVVIAGQRIQVDDSTHFDDQGLDAVGVGSVVRVSGVPVAGTPGAADARGALRASRIDRSPRDGGPAADDQDLDVKGFVSFLDTTARTFQLRASPDAAAYYAVDWGAIALPAGVVDGARVEVHTLTAPVPGVAPVLATLVASAVHLEEGLEGDEVELEGYVTSLSSGAFVVAGVTVSTDATTRYVLGTAADLVVGAKVEVDGHVPAAGGALHAEKVSFRAGVRITAPIESYTGTSLRLLGVVVQLPSWLRNDVGALSSGLVVEVRGTPTADGLGVVASRIGAGSGGNVDRVFLRAVVTAADATAGTLKVLGFTVSAGGASLKVSSADGTSSTDVSLTPAAFWSAVDPGRTVVKVRARSAADVNAAARTWIADEVELDGDE